MSREHRRPLAAFILVAIACTVLVVNANRSNARDLVRPDEPSLVAGAASTPPSTAVPPSTEAAEQPLVPIAGRTLTRRGVGAGPAPIPSAAPSDAVPAVDRELGAAERRAQARRHGRDDDRRSDGPSTAWTRGHHTGGRDEHTAPSDGGDGWVPGEWPSPLGDSPTPDAAETPGQVEDFPPRSEDFPHAR